MDIEPNHATRTAVARFLEEFKSLCASQGIYVIPREKNRAVLLALGLTQANQRDMLMALSVEDYVSGPEPDRDRPGEVWIFGLDEMAVELYIKLKIAQYTPVGSSVNVRQAVCISFHPADPPLRYPLK